MRLLMIAALSTSCLTLASCADKVVIAQHIPIPNDRMDCSFVDVRPDIPAEYKIDWAKVQSVAQAKAQFEMYRKQQLAREMVVARYLINVEGVAFACSNDAQWLRETEAALATRNEKPAKPMSGMHH